MVVVTGGTGGHVFPALAVAECALSRGHEVKLVVGGLKVALSLDEWRPVRVPGAPLSANPARALVGLAVTAWGTLRSLGLARRADAVVGAGSYASAPVVLAAALTGTASFLLEQNARAGLAVRLMSRFARRVLSSFDNPERLRAGKFLWTGCPTRALTKSDKGSAKRALGVDPAKPLILVFGGSLGALKLSRTAMLALDGGAFAGRWADAEMIVLAARQAERLSAVGSRARVLGFTPDVSPLLSAADLAVSRAGGSAMAELALFGVPAVLVPYPHAANDHQSANARRAENVGGAVRLEERDLTPDTLAAAVNALDETALSRMADNVGLLAREDAARRVVGVVEAEVGAYDRRKTLSERNGG